LQLSIKHLPALHMPVALAGAQATEQPPQCETEVLTLVSQSSAGATQSAVFPVQVLASH
jgi:hypothetical protein